LGLVPSALTHPVLWFVVFPYLPASYVEKAVIGEIFVVLVEALCGRLWLARRGTHGPSWRLPIARRPALWALVVALIANGASLGLGLLSRRLFGVP
jgi:hypothetical protein